MKAKKIIIILSIILVILITVIGVGVSAMISRSWSEFLSENRDMKAGSLMKNFDKQYNLDVSELTAYDYNKFIFHIVARNTDVEVLSSSRAIYIQQFNAIMPIERINKIDDDHIFVVYNLNRDDQNALVYVVFERIIQEFTEQDDAEAAGVEEVGEYELWEKTGEFYFVTKELSSADFENVQVGDSAETVNAIDAAVSFDAEYVFTYKDSIFVNFISYRVLTDGVMIIEFEAAPDEGTGTAPLLSDYTVKSKTFYPYGSEMPENVSSFVHANLIDFAE